MNFQRIVDKYLQSIATKTCFFGTGFWLPAVVGLEYY